MTGTILSIFHVLLPCILAKSPLREALLLFPFYRCQGWETEKNGNLSKSHSQLVGARVSTCLLYLPHHFTAQASQGTAFPSSSEDMFLDLKEVGSTKTVLPSVCLSVPKTCWGLKLASVYRQSSQNGWILTGQFACINVIKHGYIGSYIVQTLWLNKQAEECRRVSASRHQDDSNL